MKKFKCSFSEMQCKFSTLFERKSLRCWKSFLSVCLKKQRPNVSTLQPSIIRINSAWSITLNLVLKMLCTWNDYIHLPLITTKTHWQISIKHCEGVKIKKQQTLILAADIISTNIRIIKNLKEFQKFKIYKRRSETKELCVWQCFWSIK